MQQQANTKNLTGRYLEGVIRVVTPLHVAAQEKDGGKKSGKNEVFTTKMPVFTPNGRGLLAYFPGNDLRGRMRRKAADSVMKGINSPVPLAIYHALTVGANSASPETEAKSIEKLIESRDDLYLGLFGGGPRLHKSGMRVRSLYPITGPACHVGLVPGKQSVQDAAEVKFSFIKKGENGGTIAVGSEFPGITSMYDFLRNDDVLKGADMNAPVRIKNYAEAAAAWERKIAENKQAKKDAEEGNGDATKHAGLSNMFSIEAITSGTPLYLRIDFDDYLSDAQVCLAIKSLVEVLNNPIGGAVRIGFGVTHIERLNLIGLSSESGEHEEIKVIEDSDAPNGDVVIDQDIPGYADMEAKLCEYTLVKLESLLVARKSRIDENGLIVEEEPAEKPAKKKSAAKVEG